MKLEIIYAVLLVLLIPNVECKGKKDKTHENVPMTSDEDDLSAAHFYYWDTSGSSGKGSSQESGLSANGKLRRQLAYSFFLQSPMDSAVCSPISALMPLGKLALGASGATRKELLTAIGVKKLKEAKSHFKQLIRNLRDNTGVRISICSGIYVSEKDKLKSKFKKSAEEVFGTSVERVDFTQPNVAADKINAWVSSHTNHKIKGILRATDVSPSASLIVVNAIYFSGNWLYPFSKARQGVFYGPKGQQNVLLMRCDEMYKYYESSSLNAQIVAIPYKGRSKASLVIVLPKSKSSSSLTLLLKELKVAPDLLKNALKKMVSRPISLTIPKFRIETKFDLSVQYRNIGLNTMFHKGFKKIVRDKELFVSKAVQSAMIEIDERGTTAAAASGGEAIPIKGLVSPKIVVADHPFLFTIVTKNEQLFTGVLTGGPFAHAVGAKMSEV